MSSTQETFLRSCLHDDPAVAADLLRRLFASPDSPSHTLLPSHDAERSAMKTRLFLGCLQSLRERVRRARGKGDTRRAGLYRAKFYEILACFDDVAVAPDDGSTKTSAKAEEVSSLKRFSASFIATRFGARSASQESGGAEADAVRPEQLEAERNSMYSALLANPGLLRLYCGAEMDAMLDAGRIGSSGKGKAGDYGKANGYGTEPTGTYGKDREGAGLEGASTIRGVTTTGGGDVSRCDTGWRQAIMAACRASQSADRWRQLLMFGLREGRCFLDSAQSVLIECLLCHEYQRAREVLHTAEFRSLSVPCLYQSWGRCGGKEERGRILNFFKGEAQLLQEVAGLSGAIGRLGYFESICDWQAFVTR